MRYGYIYIHKNKENGHIYVGQSIQDEKRRFRKTEKNYNAYKTCPAMYAALNKYTWAGFETKIIDWADSQEELNALEEKYITEFKSADGTHGYNTVKFSEGRGKQAESTKEKIRERQLQHNKKLKEAGIIKIAPNRKEHQLINGNECKHCHDCNIWKPIAEFGFKKDTWDQLITFCRTCNRDRMRKYRILNPPKKLSKQEWEQSYKDRKLAMSEGQKNRLIKKETGPKDPVE